jgi:hypothetical protein
LTFLRREKRGHEPTSPRKLATRFAHFLGLPMKVRHNEMDIALGGKRVDPELVDWLEETSAKLTALPTEQRQHTIRLMDAHLATVTELIEHGRHGEATGRCLHLLAASLATTCGWYRFDHGQHWAAGKLWGAALQSARTAGDRDHSAGGLSDFAYQSNWLGEPKVSVDQLGYALSGTQHPTARSLLLLRRARAHAALGESTACYRDLSEAEAALSVEAADPAPGRCAWMSPADLAVDFGQCLLDLGRTGEAHARLAEGMALLLRAAQRWPSRNFRTSAMVIGPVPCATASPSFSRT